MYRRYIYIPAAILMLAAAIIGQTTISTADTYVISAKAGKVNLADGDVTLNRAGQTSVVTRGEQLGVGERVSTRATSRAEVLLNPGSYVRLGAGAEFEFVNTSLDDLRMKMLAGSAIFEVFATKDFKVSIYTPKGRITVINSGVYRVDVASGGDSIVSVIEGKAVVGESRVAVVKEGQTGTANGGTVVIGKFDTDQRDALAEWSRSRSKDLAKVASKLKNKEVRNSLISSFYGGLWGGGRGFGLWVYDPFLRSYCFLPYGYGLRSPYGYGYGANFWWYQLPVAIQWNDPTRLGGGRHDPPVDVDDNGARRARSGSTPIITRDDNGARPAPRWDPPVMSAPPVISAPVRVDKPIN